MMMPRLPYRISPGAPYLCCYAMSMMNEANFLHLVGRLALEYHITLPSHLLTAAAGRKISYYCSRLCACFCLNTLQLPYECMDFFGFTNRQPIWPPGHVGSFSHSKAIAVAAVASTRDYCSVGIDREEFIQLDNTQNYLSLLCLENEITCISESFNTLNSATTIIIFSLKEAVYKALYPIVGRCTLQDITLSNIVYRRTSCSATLGGAFAVLNKKYAITINAAISATGVYSCCTFKAHAT